MNSKDMVTDFSIGEKEERKHVADLIKALNAYLKSIKVEADEYNFCVAGPLGGSSETITDKFRWLVAFAVEGDSEGYYVHVGAISPAEVVGMYGQRMQTNERK